MSAPNPQTLQYVDLATCSQDYTFTVAYATFKTGQLSHMRHHPVNERAS